jgi:tetratricopeptide (TPR) repeat protein
MAGDVVEAAPASAQDAFDQALVLHHARRPADAETLYRAALTFDPDHADTLCYLGLLCTQQARAEEGAGLLRRAIDRDPDSPEAHNHLGAALQALGRHAEALAQHDRAVALAPDYEDARCNRGVALHALGRNAEAIECLEVVLAAEPGHAQAHFALGMALAAVDRHREAATHCRNAASLDPTYAAKLSGNFTAYSEMHPAEAQAGMQRLNQYIGLFLTNHEGARMGVYPGLTSRPFHDLRQHPGVRALEANFGAIRDEIEGLAAAEFQAEAENLMDHGAWDVFLLYERSRKNEENCARCPTITRIIERYDTVRTQAGLLYVSKLSPGTHIKPHRGPTNQRLRCHLGVRIPSGDCGLRVGGETRKWRQGECLVFDDALEHEAWNHSPEPRIVLIIDFWHPDLTPMEVAFLEGLHRFASFQANSLNRYWTANAAARVKARTGYD